MKAESSLCCDRARKGKIPQVYTARLAAEGPLEMQHFPRGGPHSHPPNDTVDLIWSLLILSLVQFPLSHVKGS